MEDRKAAVAKSNGAIANSGRHACKLQGRLPSQLWAGCLIILDHKKDSRAAFAGASATSKVKSKGQIQNTLNHWIHIKLHVHYYHTKPYTYVIHNSAHM